MSERRRAEEALRASEERFRRYFELGLIGMAMTSPTKGCLEVNDELCRILGYQRSELLQKTWAEMTYPDDLAADLAQFNLVMAGEFDGYTMDKRWIRKDGRVIDSIMAARCLRRADGSVDYFVGLVLDTTERKRAEKNLRESEHKFSVVFDKASFAIALAKLPDNTIVDVNPAWVEMFGFTREQTLGRTSVELGIDRDLERRRRVFSDVLERGAVRNLEATLFTRSGNPRLISSNIDVVSFGGEEYFLSTLRDMTEHKKAEADLRRSEANLAEGQRMSHNGSWAWSPSTETMFCSQELLRIFGLAVSAKPSHEDFLRLIHPEDQPRVRQTFERAVRTPTDYDAEYRIVRSDGSIRHIHNVARPVLSESGTLFSRLLKN